MRKTVQTVIEKMGLEPGAPNLDGYFQDDLMDFWNVSRFGWDMARFLFPDRPKAYVSTTCDLGHYAANKATAMRCREEGDISGATTYESICESIYNRLPEYARW